ncbi:MAG: hypothetical protein DRN03_02655 [Thermoplasmata archaeon]|nr:MAG: hypothetical protein DRN03_02655 [Thermoplasmata archaeon]
MAGMLAKLRFRTELMEEKVAKGFAAATQLADILVMKYGVPFRLAHRIVGRLAMEGKEQPSTSDVASAAREFGISITVTPDDLAEVLNVRRIVESRRNIGGTSKVEVERMIAVRKRKLKDKRARIERLRSRVAIGLKALYDEARRLGVDLYGRRKEGQD